MTTAPGVVSFRADVRKLFDIWPSGISMATDATYGVVTCLVPGAAATASTPGIEPLVIRVPSGHASAAAVEREARLLVELRRRRLGPVETTIPRHVGMRDFQGLPVALSSALPGRPMSTAERHRLHAAQPWLVRRDFEYAATWLGRLHDASATRRARTTWVADVADALRDRWRGHPLLPASLASLAPAAARLDACPVDLTVVHGDFWHGNVLVDPDHESVSGVVNWMSGELEGSPLRDLARFALRYARHLIEPRPMVLGAAATRPGAFGTRRSPWFPRMVGTFLRDGVARLGVPAELWPDVALAGLAEIAAHDRDDRSAAEHLAVVARTGPVRSTGRLLRMA